VPRTSPLRNDISGATLADAVLPKWIIPSKFARLLTLLAVLGLWLSRGVQSSGLDQSECGAFTIGASAIGGCDGFGGHTLGPP